MAKQRKLLIAGGGYADIPLVLAAKKLGYSVITSGNRIQDLGHQYSDEYRMADFSNLDAMLALATDLDIDAICACSNDFSALSCAYVAERMGLPGHDSFETSKIIHHKDRYRKFAWENAVQSPRAEGFTDIESAMSFAESLNFPIIVKPVDLTGGKGISTIESVDQARLALRKAFDISRAKRVVVEEFIIGTRHGFSAFLLDGKIAFFFSDNEHYYINPYMVSAASTPSIVPTSAEEKLCRESERIASLLSLKTGIFHIQYILSGEEPIIIEICRRSPGDLYTRFVEHATGVEYPLFIVKASAGLDCSDLHHVPPHGFLTRHCVMSAAPGKVQNVTFDPSIEDNVIDKFMWWKVGDEIEDVLTAKVGIVFLRFNSMEEMLAKTEKMQELIRVSVY